MQEAILQQYGDSLPEVSPLELEAILKAFPRTKVLLNHTETQLEYYSTIPVHNIHPKDSRRELFYKAIKDLAAPFFEREVIEEGIRQLRQDFTVSSTEHLNSLSEFFSLNSAFGQAIYREGKQQNALITFACATVKNDNILESRSLFVNMEKVRMLSKKYQEHMVLAAPQMDNSLFIKNLQQSLQKENISADSSQLIQTWCNNFISECKHCTQLWENIVIFNKLFWNSLLQRNKLILAENYIMLPQEILVRNALLAMLEAREENWLYSMLLDEEQLRLLEELFDGIRTCWERGTYKGTFLFWGNKNGQPVSLMLNQNRFISEDGSINIPVSREDLQFALLQEKIIPAGNLCFLYLYFYLGLRMFGGILQIQYLPEMKERFLAKNIFGLPASELEIVKNTDAELYLNLEQRLISRGGLTRLTEQIPEHYFELYKDYTIDYEIRGCLGYLGELLST